jgi:O-antigen/teichoic acid export membrane protein
MPQSFVAAYEIAWRVTEVVILPSKAIATTIFPAISKWDAERLRKRIESLFPEAITGSLLLVVPAFFGVLLYSQEILTFIFDPEYTEAWIVLILLTGEKLIAAVQLVAGRSLGALNRPDLVAGATTAGFVVNVVLNIVLVREYGIEGAAVATISASILTAILYYLSLRDHLELRFEYAELGWMVLAGGAMGLSLLGLGQFVVVDSRTTLIATITAGVVLYGGYLLIHPRFRSQVTTRIHRIAYE